jgi:hypothetical protein
MHVQWRPASDQVLVLDQKQVAAGLLSSVFKEDMAVAARMGFTGAVLPGGYDVNLASWLSERLGGKRAKDWVRAIGKAEAADLRKLRLFMGSPDV